MERRQFLQKAAIGSVAAVTAGSLVQAPAVHAKKQIQWKMVTTWPPKLPYLQDAAELLAKKVEIMSDGQFRIKVFAGGELVPPLQTFDAVQKGTTVQAGSGVAYYQAGKAPAAQWFAAVPFGLNAAGMAAGMNSAADLSCGKKPMRLLASFPVREAVPGPRWQDGSTRKSKLPRISRG